METDLMQFPQDPVPVDETRTWGQMLPEQVARVCKQQMRQFVFEHATNLKPAAAFSDLIQSFHGPF